MVFKKNYYRLGKGQNLHAKKQGDSLYLYYYLPAEGVTREKIIKRAPGFLETLAGSVIEEAKEIVPLGELFYLSRGQRVVKIK